MTRTSLDQSPQRPLREMTHAGTYERWAMRARAATTTTTTTTTTTSEVSTRPEGQVKRMSSFDRVWLFVDKGRQYPTVSIGVDRRDRIHCQWGAWHLVRGKRNGYSPASLIGPSTSSVVPVDDPSRTHRHALRARLSLCMSDSNG